MTLAPATAPGFRQPGTPRSLDEIGPALLSRSLISGEQLREARIAARSRCRPLPDVLVDLGAVSSEELLPVAAEVLGMPAVDLSTTFGDALVIEALSREKAYELAAIPLFLVANELTIAVADPLDLTRLDALRFITGRKILPAYALLSDIERHLPLYYGTYDAELDPLVFEIGGSAIEADQEVLSLEHEVQERPVARLLNLILSSALAAGATDLHLEPQEGQMVVRHRIDGMLEVRPFQIPAAASTALVSRVKVLARLDIAERRTPQDGKLRLRFSGRRVDVRVSTFPTLYGEKVVLRLLDKQRTDHRLDGLGMPEELLRRWRRSLASPNGILLVTGPTGSGKTSTLYASLLELHRPDINIVTLEDPVEYELPGVSQGQVHPAAGFTFASGLRSILRQDPDVILVGEIRDLETAQIAVQAALTGHLVLSTLHTNDAPAALTRLVDLGLPPYLIAGALRGVLSQRLVRRICPSCAAPAEADPEEEAAFRRWLGEEAPLLAGRGCSECRGTGYRGRVGIFELMEVTPAVQSMLRENPGEGAIAEAAGAGYLPISRDGASKVRAGITTPQEVIRLAAPEPAETEPDPRSESSQPPHRAGGRRWARPGCR